MAYYHERPPTSDAIFSECRRSPAPLDALDVDNIYGYAAMTFLDASDI